MFSATTTIDRNTVRAYQGTDYLVFGPPAFTLRVGQASEQLLDVHRFHKTGCSAFLTACNPWSEVLSGEANALRQDELVTALKQRNLRFLTGSGKHPTNGWPPEPGFLVFGLDLETSKSLATRFEQNAFVWNGPEGMTQLILLR